MTVLKVHVVIACEERRRGERRGEIGEREERVRVIPTS